MKQVENRKKLLKATLAITVLAVVGCAAKDDCASGNCPYQYNEQPIGMAQNVDDSNPYVIEPVAEEALPMPVVEAQPAPVVETAQTTCVTAQKATQSTAKATRKVTKKSGKVSKKALSSSSPASPKMVPVKPVVTPTAKAAKVKTKPAQNTIEQNKKANEELMASQMAELERMKAEQQAEKKRLEEEKAKLQAAKEKLAQEKQAQLATKLQTLEDENARLAEQIRLAEEKKAGLTEQVGADAAAAEAEKARLAAEEQARLEAEEQARLAAEEQARLEAEEKARIEAEQKAKAEAEEKAKREAEEQARIAAEQEAARLAEEERLKQEQLAQMNADGVAISQAPKKAAESCEDIKDWVAAEGSTLRELLLDWGDRVGWRVVWNMDRDYTLEAGAVFRGRFVDVSAALLRSFARATPAPKGVFYKGNKVLVISTREDENAD